MRNAQNHPSFAWNWQGRDVGLCRILLSSIHQTDERLKRLQLRSDLRFIGCMII